jgi:receptor expression-enhancing protein 5/6
LTAPDLILQMKINEGDEIYWLPRCTDEFFFTVNASNSFLFFVFPIDYLVQLEIKTGQPKAYFFLAGAALILALSILVAGGKLIVDLCGFVYPAYMSLKSLEANNDDVQWLTYWVVFSTYYIIESFLGPVVKLIPMYFYIKIAIIVYLYHPSTKGATLIYQQAIRPLLLPYLEADKGASKKD